MINTHKAAMMIKWMVLCTMPVSGTYYIWEKYLIAKENESCMLRVFKFVLYKILPNSIEHILIYKDQYPITYFYACLTLYYQLEDKEASC